LRVKVSGSLAGGVAHDLNNMLMILDSFTELLERSVPSTSTAHMNLDQIRRTTAKAFPLCVFLNLVRTNLTKP
jgi:hypothetical protein